MGQHYVLGLPCLDVVGPDSSRWPHQAFYGNLIKTDWWKPGLEKGAARLCWRRWGHFPISLLGTYKFYASHESVNTYSLQSGTIIMRDKNTKKPVLDTAYMHGPLPNTGAWQLYQINGLSLKTDLRRKKQYTGRKAMLFHSCPCLKHVACIFFFFGGGAIQILCVRELGSSLQIKGQIQNKPWV